MSSSVHFKFKSQKEPSRVTFDGTGISVFELKREIINQNRLGDGTDFELSIYNQDTGEEYDDDTSIIPRSTSVIARRLPPARPGKGSAARYVSGKMPVTARNTSRAELLSSTRSTAGAGQVINSNISELDNAQTEDEKINALLNLQANQWREQQQEMTNATPIAFGRGRGKAVNVPDHPPPPGYLCYRCREKGHWIQACPTNNDPKFDGRYRVKRSTGIPRSLQTKIEKSAAMAMDGSTEDLKSSGVMVNADGDFVIAQPDKAAWELYQEKAKASAAAAAEAAAAEGSKELQARGLECPIDKRMFLEPTTTPCCKRTYCNDCITNALIESDFVCPGCATEGVLLDNLSVNDEAVAKIKAYEVEKVEVRKEKEKPEQIDNSAHSTRRELERDISRSPIISSPKLSDRPSSGQSKKRSAEDLLSRETPEDNNPAPVMKKQKSQEQQKYGGNSNPQMDNILSSIPPFPFDQPMSFSNSGFSQPQALGTVPFSENNSIHGNMGFINTMMLPAGNGFPNAMPNGWSQMNRVDFPFQPNRIFGDAVNHSMMLSNGYGQPSVLHGGVATSMPVHQMGQMAGFMNQPSSFQQGSGMNTFSNQQRTAFSAPSAREEENAYFRQPVNPHRHQARQRRIRPSDYREL